MSTSKWLETGVQYDLQATLSVNYHRPTCGCARWNNVGLDSVCQESSEQHTGGSGVNWRSVDHNDQRCNDGTPSSGFLDCYW
ncbi:hypothetical protein GQ600_21738 [Phytophthora cactorum]|nr:hypothetical protein GQ600_21738 [Phytophthora cactorum]